jgi:hypothetical protein
MEKLMKDYYIFTIRLDEKMHQEVSDYAHLLRKSMADIIREGITLRLNQIKNPLTSSDIAI